MLIIDNKANHRQQDRWKKIPELNQCGNETTNSVSRDTSELPL